jgi:adenylate cyclase
MSTLHLPREHSLGSHGSEQVLDALRRVLASSDFIASGRNRRFLSYVIEETLAGRAERLKGYTIAVQVFGRDATFDAQADPLVRIEARRLRQSLERYYLTAGVADPIRISIPKGGYVPAFETFISAQTAAPPSKQAGPDKPRLGRAARRASQTFVASLAAVAAAAAIVIAVERFGEDDPASLLQPKVMPFGPSIVVEPFANVEGSPIEDRFRVGLTDELTHALARFKTIQVASTRHADPASGSPSSVTRGPSQISADYVLKGSVRAINQIVRIVIQLEEHESGTLLWTRVFDYDADRDDLVEAQSEVAATVATTLGDPYDVLFSNELKKVREPDPPGSDAYACALRFYVYWLNPTKAEHQSLRDCHERSVNSATHYASIWTNLAWLYLDELRFDYNRNDAADPPLERAAEAARRAVSLQPDSARAHLAAAIVQWFRKDFRSFDRHAELALLLNPNDATVNAELGLRYGLRGDWVRSGPLVDRAISRDPIRWQTYRVSYAQNAVEVGDFERALEELRLTKGTDHPVLKVLRAAVYGHLNRIDEARADWHAATQAMPRLREQPRAWIDDRSPSPPLRRRILEGLEKAGVLEEEE